MATWPSSLDQELLAGDFTYTQKPQIIRTEMDTGPVFQRRRSTAEIKLIQGSIQVTNSQYAIFWDFFNNTLNGGTDSFNWVHPITQNSADIQFSQVPVMRSVVTGMLFEVSMQLEVLP